MAEVTFDQAHFDALYAGDPDPWQFRSSTYERRKYARTLAALPRKRYRHLLELGCSIGELTARLAARADTVTGVETSPLAIATASARCAGLSNVGFVQAHLPEGDWMLSADAVVLSEVLYYLQPQAVDALVARLGEGARCADMILVHWTGPTDYPMTGDAAADRFIAAMRSHTGRTRRTSHYRLDVLRPRSIRD